MSSHHPVVLEAVRKASEAPHLVQDLAQALTEAIDSRAAGATATGRTTTLSLAYQPQVCLSSGQIVGAEALLRWQSTAWGAVPIDQLIARAEDAGLIQRLGQWILREVCDQIVRWRQAGLKPIRVAMNLSPGQFLETDMASAITRALAESGAEPGWLALEVTEQVLLRDAARVGATLKALHQQGVEIVLDDFGTGASSLASLRALPVGLLKVDRSFIAELTTSPECASVTRAVIGLARALKIPVLAEGVEQEGQLRMLKAHGCDRIQGYLFSPPVGAAELTELLLAGHRLAMPEDANGQAPGTLLLVDDEPHILSALKRLFRRDGWRVLTATSGHDALTLLGAETADVILSDQRMPGMTGVEFLRRAKVLHPDTIRITLSGFTDLQSIIDAVNEGAVYKFLTKPWDDERLRSHVQQAFAQKGMADENRRLQAQLGQAHAEQAALNQRLAQLLSRQTQVAELMHDSAANLRNVLDNLPVAVLGLDPDGMLAYANEVGLIALAASWPEQPVMLGSPLPSDVAAWRLGLPWGALPADGPSRDRPAKPAQTSGPSRAAEQPRHPVPPPEAAWRVALPAPAREGASSPDLPGEMLVWLPHGLTEHRP